MVSQHWQVLMIWLLIAAAFTGVQCDAQIQNATDTIQAMLDTSSGQAQLQKDFGTCSPLNNTDDISQFMSALMGYVYK
jgi:hypothetical protein